MFTRVLSRHKAHRFIVRVCGNKKGNSGMLFAGNAANGGASITAMYCYGGIKVVLGSGNGMDSIFRFNED